MNAPLVLAAVLARSPLPATALAPTCARRRASVAAGVDRARARAFDLVGLHWRGSGASSFRTRSVAGALERVAARRARGGPARRADARARARAAGSSATRTGRARRTRPGTDYAAASRGCARLRLGARPSVAAPRHVAIAGSPRSSRARAGARTSAIRRAPAALRATRVRFAVVHHTAGSNTYTRGPVGGDRPRRSSSTTCKANGWNDIGYNFLVDKYGQVFEGRYGGIDRNVVGAHAEGFNTGSVGRRAARDVRARAVDRTAARAALVELLAWRLDLAHVDPLSSFSWSRREPEVPGRARRSRCARSRATATRASRPAPAAALRRAAEHRARRWRRPACRSSTPRRSTGAPGGLVRFTGRSRRRCRGR